MIENKQENFNKSQDFKTKMLNYNKIMNSISQFPDNLEILIQQSGRQNEFIRKIAVFVGAVEFLKKEFDIDISKVLNQDQVKYSAMCKFLDYLDKPYTKEFPTYERYLMTKTYQQFDNEQEDMNYIPLQLQPLYIIDRQKSNDTLIVEKENQILNNDTIKKQYKQMQEDIKQQEEKIKKYCEENKKEYIPPCENYYREKAIMTLFYYTFQAESVNKLHIEQDNSSIGLMSHLLPYYPRESGKFDSSIESIIHLFKLLPQKQQIDLAQQLNLLKNGEDFNEDEILKKLSNLKDQEQEKISADIKSLI